MPFRGEKCHSGHEKSHKGHGKGSLRHGVVAVAAPGVAAEYAADSKVQALEGSVFAECLESILGTGRSEAA